MYPGGTNDLNIGNASPKQYDVASCQSFCKTNYPAAKYFEWVSTASLNHNGHNTCYCKVSNANKYAAVYGGTFAGEVDCGGE